ncbi:glycoside hydrolase family 16 protein [Roseateles sp. LKC17W]|uniref:Glycoside hydrolase family 16 protein n=1 Tax=Pelomonas margarita TaxID=3299031 RepID=A0ABW7FPY6_9BURK
MKRALALLALAAACSAPARAQSTAEFFDDFSQKDLDALRASGWVLREGSGHPGLPGARFSAAQLALDGGLLRLRLDTDGTPANTTLAQLCGARKLLIGTTSARVRLRDTPGSRDPIVQAFFLAGPLRHDYDPDFSEVDFEYLPHGGWGSPDTRLYGVSWQTVRVQPFQPFNQASQLPGSFDGWQLLTVQVEATRTRHYVNGRLLGEHTGRNVPAKPMAISFNHWLSAGAVAGAPRAYAFEVDWVLHQAGRTLPPEAMQARADQLRQQGVARHDTVPDVGLTSECNL